MDAPKPPWRALVPGQLVFVNRYFFPDESATSRILSDLAFRLAKCGLPVAVVTSRQLYDNPNAALPATEVIDGVTVHRVRTATLGRANLAGRALDYASFHLAAAARLHSLLKPGDIVVAKTDPPLMSILTSHVARVRGAVLINWLQDLFPEVAIALGAGAIPGWLGERLKRARDRSLRRAAVNIVLGTRMRDYLTARGLDASRMRVVPNWAEVEHVTPRTPEESLIRQELGLSGRFVVAYSGNLGRAHEFETLLGAARLLRDDPQFAFLITGGGARAASLRAVVEAERLTSFCFQSFQPRERLADSLAAADVHLVSLLPALEGFIVPSKLYGILGAARPAIFIGDTQGDLATVLRENDCGISVGVGESERLASHLRALSVAPHRVAEMGAKARSLAAARYTSERAVADWLEILQTISAARTARYAWQATSARSTITNP